MTTMAVCFRQDAKNFIIESNQRMKQLVSCSNCGIAFVPEDRSIVKLRGTGRTMFRVEETPCCEKECYVEPVTDQVPKSVKIKETETLVSQ